ncbi:Calcium-transporting ATPase 2 [Colletotrichum sp. SAR 10_66]|nr:Calcium-transporting ATPase 2 [Colletotrichum sp. SAR 10_76]KAJ5003264.1 Calcium-transporting ATPase 2 [Colletotrichum sp. SAR 10_66]
MAGNMLAPPAPHGPARSRSASKTDTIISTTSNPFLTPTVTSCASSSHEDSEDALKPDPGTESDFKVDNNPFAFSPGQLNKLLNPKSLAAFRALGGLNGIAYGLQSDINTGLSVDETEAPGTVSFQDAVSPISSQHSKAQWPSTTAATRNAFEDRIRVYKRNFLPAKKATPLWKLMWNAYNDQVLILLTVAAVISLALGLYETLGVEHPPGSPTPVDWVEGVAICAAIAIVTLVGSINDWQKERAFVRLSAKKDEREVKVTRSGKQALISVYDVLVGDVLHLEPGDLVPVDGVYIDGHELRCDESSATGESDAIKKTGGSIVMRALENGESVRNLDPFIVSGAKVLEGVGTFMCTSVGVNSSFGKIMMSVRTETEPTPLQKKLEGLAMAIAKLGSAAAGLLFFVLLFRFLAGLPNDSRPSTDKASSFMDILIVAVTIIVVAVPEGLPLAVTLALAFATTRMLKENNLTTNKMTVVAGRFDDTSFSASESLGTSSPSIPTWASNTSPAFKEVLIQSVAINSTAFEGEEEGKSVFIGSKTETALLQLAKDHLGLQSLAEIRANEQVIHLMPFDSSKKCMGAVIRLRSGTYRLLVKGASEILLEYCSTKANFTTLDAEILTAMDRVSFTDTIDEYANRSLRTIGLVYKDYQEWPPSSATNDATCCTDLGRLLQTRDLFFLGVVGIQDPVRPGVPEAVRKAKHAGVNVRMVTGDNAVTAKAIASECGIYTDGIVMEGPDFRRLSDAEMDNMLPNLQVLARSSPEDKRILVSKLKALGETVAVTGDGTNDAPALKAADIGFSMGVSGTEVAKEASSIILMDDNFTSIITALKWGRAVNDAVQKFLQVAVYDAEMKPVLTAVQLLWVNLIMDTFAALALATDPPTEKILDRPPQGKKKALITTNMWKMIIGQSIYQLIVTFVLYFGGGAILNYDLNDPDKKLELETIVFNTFVWMQIFNEFNNRRLDNKFNIFEGVHRNLFFIVINCIMVGLQLSIIFIGSRAFQISPGGLDGTQWGISIVASALCLPWAILVRLFPDAWFAAIAELVGRPFLACHSCLSTGISSLVGSLRRKRKEDAETGRPPVVVVSNDIGIGDQEKI